MPKLIIVIGLPGSGKTHYLENLKRDGEVYAFYDDYQKNPYGRKETDPRLSRNFGPLVSKLKSGKAMAVSDIIYTRQKDLNALISSVVAILPETEIELHYFENSAEKAMANVRERAREKTMEKELAFIKKHAPGYKIAITKTVPIHANHPKSTIQKSSSLRMK